MTAGRDTSADSAPRFLGAPGVRDPEFPCSDYRPGDPAGRCDSDGHYLCGGCRHRVATLNPLAFGDSPCDDPSLTDREAR